MTRRGAALGATWRDHLRPDETLMWQGQPDASFRLTRSAISKSVPGVAFILFAAVMLNVTWDDILRWGWPDMAPIMIIAGLMIAFGTYMIIRGPFRDQRERRHLVYSLTNQRAIIASTLRGRTMREWPLGPDMPVRFIEGDPWSTLYFAQDVYTPRDRDKSPKITLIGFEEIADGPEVFALFQKLRAEAQT